MVCKLHFNKAVFKSHEVTGDDGSVLMGYIVT